MRRRDTLTAILGGLLLAAAARAAVPAGFTDHLVATVGRPTALAFTPDGRLLITSQEGVLRVYEGGSLSPTWALAIPQADGICTDSERGLLGVAVDPAFATNQFIYLFYTSKRPTAPHCVNRVSRYILPPDNLIDPGTQRVLIDNMPSPNGNHNGGDLQFGKDGNLYVSIGDGGPPAAARDEHVLSGKVLRIAPDGSIPADNPFQGAGTARCNETGATVPGNRCQETFAWGLRNPFRLGFDPNAAGTRFFVNDVGAGAWEEIDLGQAGADYGWNCREGAHTNSTSGACSPTPAGMVDPIFEYAHDTQIPGTTSPASCNCVSGGAFVPDGLWPGYDGAYLFADCTCGGIFRLSPSGSGFAASDFGSGLGTVVHLLFGPLGATQALYYTTYAGGGQVRRINLDPPPASDLDFFSLRPCRLVDTRGPFGPRGGPALSGGLSGSGGPPRTFDVAGVCEVPATARAVALNLTAVAAGRAGHLTAYPADSPAPTTSTLNFSAGQTRANNAVLALGPGGRLTVRATIPLGGAVHLVLDVFGYFE